MDLYVQIGVLFLLGIALSALIYAYNYPKGSLETQVTQAKEEVTINTNRVLESKLNRYHVRDDITGKEVKDFILGLSPEDELTIFVKTKASRIGTIMYGTQRISKHGRTYASTYVAVDSTGTSTLRDYESTYSISVASLFKPSINTGSDRIIMYNARDTLSDGASTMNSTIDMEVVPSIYQSQAFNVRTSAVQIMLSNPVTKDLSVKTGYGYSNSEVNHNVKPNFNFSQILNPASRYNIGDGLTFNSILIRDIRSNEITGVYFEERNSDYGTGVIQTLLDMRNTR